MDGVNKIWKSHDSGIKPSCFSLKTLVVPEFGTVLACIRFDSTNPTLIAEKLRREQGMSQGYNQFNPDFFNEGGDIIPNGGGGGDTLGGGGGGGGGGMRQFRQSMANEQRRGYQLPIVASFEDHSKDDDYSFGYSLFFYLCLFFVCVFFVFFVFVFFLLCFVFVFIAPKKEKETYIQNNDKK